MSSRECRVSGAKGFGRTKASRKKNLKDAHTKRREGNDREKEGSNINRNFNSRYSEKAGR